MPVNTNSIMSNDSLAASLFQGHDYNRSLVGDSLVQQSMEWEKLPDAKPKTNHIGEFFDDVANFFTAANGYICHDGVKVYVAGRYHADEASKLADGIKKVTPAAVKKAVRYNIAGQRVDDSYKGFVIENGVTKLAK